MRPLGKLLHMCLLALAAVAGACVQRTDVAAEERAIRDLDKKWVEAVAVKDTVAVTNMYAEDAEFLVPEAPRVSGRAAIRSAWAQLLQAPNLAFHFEPTRVFVSSAGDIAYETGSYHLAYDLPKGKRLEDVGKYVVAWRKLGNEWKVQYDIFNSDKPGM
jgi:uncharacterized protein (TIGR02246 family)